MAYYMTPLEEVILYPGITDWEPVNMSQFTFVKKLLAANTEMPVKLLTCENIKYIFVRTSGL